MCSGYTGSADGGSNAGVSASGADVLFDTREQLIPSDGDQGNDVYDARVEGGFSQAGPESCSGELCQPPAPNPPASPAPETAKPGGDGNVKPPKPCPKGKVRKKNGRCVKQHTKGQKHKKQGKKASHKQGGGK